MDQQRQLEFIDFIFDGFVWVCLCICEQQPQNMIRTDGDAMDGMFNIGATRASIFMGRF